MEKNIKDAQELYTDWLEDAGGQDNAAERDLKQVSRELDALAENAGIDLDDLLATYEEAARRAGFMAGLAAQGQQVAARSGQRPGGVTPLQPLT